MSDENKPRCGDTGNRRNGDHANTDFDPQVLKDIPPEILDSFARRGPGSAAFVEFLRETGRVRG